MNKEKTIEQRLHTYAISQKPLNGVESVANIDDSLDRHMPPSKNLFWIALCSPILALGAWLLLIWCCLNTDAN